MEKPIKMWLQLLLSLLLLTLVNLGHGSPSNITTSNSPKVNATANLVFKSTKGTIEKRHLVSSTASESEDALFSFFGGVSRNPPDIVPKVSSYNGHIPKDLGLQLVSSDLLNKGKKVKEELKNLLAGDSDSTVVWQYPTVFGLPEDIGIGNVLLPSTSYDHDQAPKAPGVESDTLLNDIDGWTIQASHSADPYLLGDDHGGSTGQGQQNLFEPGTGSYILVGPDSINNAFDGDTVQNDLHGDYSNLQPVTNNEQEFPPDQIAEESTQPQVQVQAPQESSLPSITIQASHQPILPFHFISSMSPSSSTSAYESGAGTADRGRAMAMPLQPEEQAILQSAKQSQVDMDQHLQQVIFSTLKILTDPRYEQSGYSNLNYQPKEVPATTTPKPGTITTMATEKPLPFQVEYSGQDLNTLYSVFGQMQPQPLTQQKQPTTTEKPLRLDYSGQDLNSLLGQIQPVTKKPKQSKPNPGRHSRENSDYAPPLDLFQYQHQDPRPHYQQQHNNIQNEYKNQPQPQNTFEFHNERFMQNQIDQNQQIQIQVVHGPGQGQGDQNSFIQAFEKHVTKTSLKPSKRPKAGPGPTHHDITTLHVQPLRQLTPPPPPPKEIYQKYSPVNQKKHTQKEKNRDYYAPDFPHALRQQIKSQPKRIPSSKDIGQNQQHFYHNHKQEQHQPQQSTHQDQTQQPIFHNQSQQSIFHNQLQPQQSSDHHQHQPQQSTYQNKPKPRQLTYHIMHQPQRQPEQSAHHNLSQPQKSTFHHQPQLQPEQSTYHHQPPQLSTFHIVQHPHLQVQPEQSTNHNRAHPQQLTYHITHQSQLEHQQSTNYNQPQPQKSTYHQSQPQQPMNQNQQPTYHILHQPQLQHEQPTNQNQPQSQQSTYHNHPQQSAPQNPHQQTEPIHHYFQQEQSEHSPIVYSYQLPQQHQQPWDNIVLQHHPNPNPVQQSHISNFLDHDQHFHHQHQQQAPMKMTKIITIQERPPHEAKHAQPIQQHQHHHQHQQQHRPTTYRPTTPTKNQQFTPEQQLQSAISTLQYTTRQEQDEQQQYIPVMVAPTTSYQLMSSPPTATVSPLRQQNHQQNQHPIDLQFSPPISITQQKQEAGGTSPQISLNFDSTSDFEHPPTIAQDILEFLANSLKK